MDGLVKIKVKELPDGRIIIYKTMPDISMCSNNSCPLKGSCYRFTAIPYEFMQTYALFEFKTIKGITTCENYWK